MYGKNFEIVTIAGNRPEIIKLSELVKSFNGIYKNAFVYTGQHYSPNMRDVFFEQLNINFDYDLQLNSSNVDLLRSNIRKLLTNLHPSFVIVYGDTNSTLAGALAAKDVNCKLIHIEAGIRCFDLSKPEERNRIQVDSLSDYLLAPTELSKLFLKYENIFQEKVFVTGNLIADVCKKFSGASSPRLRSDPENDLPREYILLTIHRPALVDDPVMLKELSEFLSQVNYTIVFPMHPRTVNSLIKYNISLPENVKAIGAVGYVDFLNMLKECKLVMTDSGGVQEEAIILKKPCITLSNTSDRQETILLKANRLFFPLIGGQHDRSINDIIEEMRRVKITINPYGENVTEKALKVISDITNNTKEQKVELQPGKIRHL
ncbi:MAG: UDP-N-acetylglucosamine 2-epimerase (non-hydrolyzing) [Candidatus Nitrosopolaris sp.]